MFTTYILKNVVSGKFYVGSTNDFNRRLSEHNRGQTRSTKRTGEWELVYPERYETNLESKRREKVIKSYKGGNAFKLLLKQ